MNLHEVVTIPREDRTTLLYSYDDGFTRYAVDLFPDGGYACRLNESPCFRRGTHDRMAKVYGESLIEQHCRTFGC